MTVTQVARLISPAWLTAKHWNIPESGAEALAICRFPLLRIVMWVLVWALATVQGVVMGYVYFCYHGYYVRGMAPEYLASIL